MDAEAEAPVLWPPDAKSWLIGKDPDAGEDWRQEEEGTTEDEIVGWYFLLPSRPVGSPSVILQNFLGKLSQSLACFLLELRKRFSLFFFLKAVYFFSFPRAFGYCEFELIKMNKWEMKTNNL